VWDINLKDLNRLIENIKSAKNLLRDLFAITAILIFILSLILPLNNFQLLYLMLIIISLMILVYIVIQHRRNEELATIKM